MKNYTYKIIETSEQMCMAFCVRSIVFIEEQVCAYTEEFDGLDDDATHFIGLDGGEPFATARIRIKEKAVKIERLALRKAYRGNGNGRHFFGYLLKYCERLGYGRIVLHAQAHLTGFYEGFGFVKKGEIFEEAGIPHYYMEKHIG